MGCLETQDYEGYVEFCFTCLGVWRLYHNLSPVYVLLISDADWVRGLDNRHFQSYENLVSIDVHQLISAAQNYWSSELVSVGIKVFEKLEALFKFPIKSPDSTFFQNRSLTLTYDDAMYLMDSKCLKQRNQDTVTLQKFLTFSTEKFITCVFPLDWRNSARENMISLRRTNASQSMLRQVIVECISGKNNLSYGKIGKVVMIILGSGKPNSELYSKLVQKLICNPPWMPFIETLCEDMGPWSHSGEPKQVSVLWRFHEALVATYGINWRCVYDYISPGCFFYLVERLFDFGVLLSCFHG